MSSNNYDEKWLLAQFRFANHLRLIPCFITCEKWMQREKYLNNKTYHNISQIRWSELPS